MRNWRRCWRVRLMLYTVDSHRHPPTFYLLPPTNQQPTINQQSVFFSLLLISYHIGTGWEVLDTRGISKVRRIPSKWSFEKMSIMINIALETFYQDTEKLINDYAKLLVYDMQSSITRKYNEVLNIALYETTSIVESSCTCSCLYQLLSLFFSIVYLLFLLFQ